MSFYKKYVAPGAAGATVLIAVTLVVSACLHAAQSSGAPAFDGARAFEHLRQIVAIGPRAAGSQGAELTRLYITQQLSIIGLTAEEQPFVAQTPLGTVRMTNLRATIPGPGPDGSSSGATTTRSSSASSPSSGPTTADRARRSSSSWRGRSRRAPTR